MRLQGFDGLTVNIVDFPHVNQKTLDLSLVTDTYHVYILTCVHVNRTSVCICNDNHKIMNQNYDRYTYVHRNMQPEWSSMSLIASTCR